MAGPCVATACGMLRIDVDGVFHGKPVRRPRPVRAMYSLTSRARKSPNSSQRSFPARGREGEGHEGEGGGGVADPEGNQHRLRQQGRLEGGETRQKFGEACGGGMEGCDGAAGAVRAGKLRCEEFGDFRARGVREYIARTGRGRRTGLPWKTPSTSILNMPHAVAAHGPAIRFRMR